MIKELHLKNFKCFESQNIPLGGLTLLTGLNGMGKSSVMQALLLIRQSFAGYQPSSMSLILNGDLVRLGTARDILCENASDEVLEIGLNWENNLDAKVVSQYNSKSDVLKVISPPIPDGIISSMQPFVGNFQYLQAERLGPRLTNLASDYHVRERRQIGAAGEYTEHFIQEFGGSPVHEKMRHSGTLGNTNLKNQINAWMHQISPGTELHLYGHPEMDVVHLRYSFLTGSQRSNEYRAPSVGFGITYVLPVITSILSSTPGALLLVENPEAHLHPGGQFLLGELLAKAASAGVQVIVETHSDHVLNGVRVAVREEVLSHESVKIHYFSRTELNERVYTKIETPVVNKMGRIDSWPVGFFDEWDKGLERLIDQKGN